MKKLCILICCVLLLQMLCACNGKNEELKAPVNFYFRNKEITYDSPTAVIYPEVREGAGFHENLTAMLRSYFLGPNSSDLERFIPTDVYMVSCEHTADEVTIVMSNQFTKVTGVDLTAACSALLLTVHDFTGAETLKISAKDAQLDDKDEIVMSIEDIVLIDMVK